MHTERGVLYHGQGNKHTLQEGVLYRAQGDKRTQPEGAIIVERVTNAHCRRVLDRGTSAHCRKGFLNQREEVGIPPLWIGATVTLSRVFPLLWIGDKCAL